jgi:hypothetical protein
MPVQGGSIVLRLHAAAKFGDTAQVIRLLDEAAQAGRLPLAAVLGAVDASEQTPLHWAAERGHAEVCTLLLQRGGGAQLEAANAWGGRPLHCSALAGHEAVCALLVARGADRTAMATGAGWQGMTAASIAMEQRHVMGRGVLHCFPAVTTAEWWGLRAGRHDDDPAVCEELAEHVAELAAEQTWRAELEANFRRPREQEERDIQRAVEASLMPASKHSMQADEDLAAHNLSIYGNPFGPREVDPLEMQVSNGQSATVLSLTGCCRVCQPGGALRAAATERDFPHRTRVPISPPVPHSSCACTDAGCGAAGVAMARTKQKQRAMAELERTRAAEHGRESLFSEPVGWDEEEEEEEEEEGRADADELVSPPTTSSSDEEERSEEGECECEWALAEDGSTLRTRAIYMSVSYCFTRRAEASADWIHSVGAYSQARASRR